MNRCVTSRFYTFVLVLLWIAGVVAGPSAYADQLADGLLASAIVRLDARGVEISIKRGANVKAALRHPDAPSVTRYPVELALNALADRDDPTAANKAEKILHLLFAKGATLRGSPDELFTVVADGHERILKLLLEQGANPHVRLYGYLPSELAIKYQQEHLLPILLARGLPKVSPEEVIQIRFVDAASRQDKAGMERTLEEGAAVNGIDAAGNLALVEYLSVPLTTAEDYENLMWLLAQGADPSKGELNEEQTSFTPPH